MRGYKSPGISPSSLPSRGQPALACGALRGDMPFSYSACLFSGKGLDWRYNCSDQKFEGGEGRQERRDTELVSLLCSPGD